tara:strand:+ start:402 stop:608 length:207 start_codon:yes stop_codon:yes gene_type:complete
MGSNYIILEILLFVILVFLIMKISNQLKLSSTLLEKQCNHNLDLVTDQIVMLKQEIKAIRVDYERIKN